MKIKVCGLKHAENITAILEGKPDLIGFIFYDRSLRFVGNGLDSDFVRKIQEKIITVGVFVNESTDQITQVCQEYGLNYVQLHGDESIEDCALLKQEGLGVIKVFQVDIEFDFTRVLPFVPHVDFFLFDTKGDQRGGTGEKFDWTILNAYTGSVPFFLSGGISIEDVDRIIDIRHPQLHGVDINSRFEVSPGKKNVKLVSDFIKRLRDAVHG